MKKIILSFLMFYSLTALTEKLSWSGPDFLIIGSKCGAIPLYNCLVEHPQVKPATEKELNFFSRHFDKGINWYQKQFPQKLSNDTFLTGEVTPTYLQDRFAAQLIAKLFPHIRIIILLRNPVDRVFSDYKTILRQEKETSSFEETIKLDIKTLEKYSNYSSSDDIIKYLKCRHLRTGFYLPHIKEWVNHFPKEQFLILLSDDLFNNPAETVNKVFHFLGIPEYTLSSSPKHAAINNDIIIKPETREMLTSLFKPFNKALQDFLTDELGLNIQLNWD